MVFARVCPVIYLLMEFLLFAFSKLNRFPRRVFLVSLTPFVGVLCSPLARETPAVSVLTWRTRFLLVLDPFEIAWWFLACVGSIVRWFLAGRQHEQDGPVPVHATHPHPAGVQESFGRVSRRGRAGGKDDKVTCYDRISFLKGTKQTGLS